MMSWYGAVLFAYIVPEICDGILAIADQLRLRLGAMILFAFDVRKKGGYLAIYVLLTVSPFIFINSRWLLLTALLVRYHLCFSILLGNLTLESPETNWGPEGLD